ncbi:MULTISPECIES: nucleotide exchange factor GrpE [Methylobacterium]|uniref:Protein GrpE n=2 Tax=Methylobacterium TaxID=407 RepID=A0A0C6F8C1_9HYPH|nr:MULTISPECIES: nucleotide exchange factor GrpE [Methylobacterium]MBK3397493.1 nucleotide exchange factor GrpE [Methylobacterium ajmalii]MBK3409093.1 nucleotide exchange factor GrpE [Methylobacterium ajmalii]MBK3424955.1 nucleotide exchange factor GrpE [Methylobacterium ajmalii]MBZ6414088.1 nucleotide exchange factor GrpE [Methylobacterium sp.]SFF62734.1 molecular chaperone GrpE [Methylobacterium sp. yr596]
MTPNDTENAARAHEPEAAEGAPASAPEAAPKGDALATLEAEKLDLKDKLLRTLADMENLRRRTEREVADARTYAVTNFARDMLNAADNVRRALESVPAEARETAEGALKALVDGIELTERDLLKTLERHGVKRVDPQGQRFDPNLHQAMFEVPNPDVTSGTVVQVVQSGYVIGERVLRPALVGVAKGGPKAEAKPAEA